MSFEALDEMVWNLSDLSLSNKSSVTLDATEPDYILHLASQRCPSDQTPVLAATTSNYSLRLYNRSNLASFQVVSGHTDVITDIRFSRSTPHLVYTSSLDETVRCWDVRKKGDRAAQTFQGYESSSNKFLTCDISPGDSLLCAGTELDESTDDHDAFIVFWDVRMQKLTGTFSECHSDHINQVRFHPSHFYKLASGSVDGLVCLFDLREEKEEDAVRQVLNTETSVNQVGWCKRDGMDSVYVTTTIETMFVWNEEGDMLSKLDTLREDFEEKNHIDYLVDCFYDNEADDLYVLGGEHGGEVQVFSIDGSTASPIRRLTKGHRATVRCLTWDQKASITGTLRQCTTSCTLHDIMYRRNSKSLVTGGEDSMVCLWQSEKCRRSLAKPKRHKDGVTLKSKKKDRNKKHKEKPY